MAYGNDEKKAGATIYNLPSTTAKKLRISIFRNIRWITTFCLLGIAAVLLLNAVNFQVDCSKMGDSVFSSRRIDDVCCGIDPEKEAQKFLQQHHQVIARTIQKDLDVIKAGAEELNRYFDIQQDQIGPFIDELFSMRSKTRMLYYYLKGDDRLESYIEKTAFRYFGGPVQLSEETARITAVMCKELEANHNLLMLNLEADLALLPERLELRRSDAKSFVRQFHLSFDRALRGLLPQTVGVQAGIEAISLVIDTWVAGAIGGAIAGALVSQGIIGGGAMVAEGAAVTAGAANSWWSFGISMVVGVTVALVIDYAANRVAMNNAEKKIQTAFESWRQNTVTSFRQDALRGLRQLHEKRELALKKALRLEIAGIASSGAKPETRR